MISKYLAGGCVILGLLLVIAGMEIRNLKTINGTLEDQKVELQDAVKEANAATDKMTAFAEADRDIATDLRADLIKIAAVNTDVTNEINKLRSEEHEKALQNPYKRGRAAGSRLKSLWLRIEANPYQGIDYLNPAGAGNPPDSTGKTD